MAGDDLKRVQAGQDLEEVLTAPLLNELIDMVRERRAGKRPPQRDDRRQLPNQNIIRVKNASGFPRKRFDVMAVAISLPSGSQAVFNPSYGGTVTASFLERPYFNVDAPYWPIQIGKFCILQEPLAVDGFGTAVISGVSLAWVDVATYTWYGRPYADIVNPADSDPELGDDEAGKTAKCKKLVVREYGGAEILYADYEPIPGAVADGRRLALVRLGHFHNEPFPVIIQDEVTPTSYGADAEVQSETADGGLISTGRVIPVYFQMWGGSVEHAIPSGQVCYVQVNRHSGLYNILQSNQFYLSRHFIE
ncbi:MAG: hypothetical protein K8U03_09195 [Planctomycetia bacterium]|nr:hypothetical protein [Planctomycetia bacterium]